MVGGDFVESFEAQITELIPRLRRYARVLTGNRAHADDLVQDTLERSWARQHHWRPGTDLRAWMFTIMHNLHVNQLRRRQPTPGADVDELAVAPAQERALELHNVQSALARLPVESREVLLLVAVEEMRYAEAAAVLKVPIGTVMSRLSRGREQLRALLDGGPLLRRVK
jgi:RNA polymerase sigma-70 factor (ECF subfamily)